MLKLMLYERRLWLQSTGHDKLVAVERPGQKVAVIADVARRAGSPADDLPVARSTVAESAGMRAAAKA